MVSRNRQCSDLRPSHAVYLKMIFSSNFDMITARTTKSEINLWIGSRDQASRVTDVRKYVVFLRKAEAVVIV